MSVSKKVIRPQKLREQLVRCFGGSVGVDTITPSDLAGHHKTLDSLDGPKGVPFIGNFLTYLMPKNKGMMHVVQVSTFMPKLCFSSLKYLFVLLR